MSDAHTCSYHCDRPACIKAQRDELRDKFQVMQAQAEIDAKAQRIAKAQAPQHDGCEPIGAIDYGMRAGVLLTQVGESLPHGTKLYTTPQPAVPDEKKRYSDSPYEGGYADGWNACRKALLSAGKEKNT